MQSQEDYTIRESIWGTDWVYLSRRTQCIGNFWGVKWGKCNATRHLKEISFARKKNTTAVGRGKRWITSFPHKQKKRGGRNKGYLVREIKSLYAFRDLEAREEE